MEEDDKSSLVGLFMLRRHQAGMKGKKATAFTTGLRLRFAQGGASTEFLNAAVIATARAACKHKPEELRDMAVARTICTNLLGSGAVVDEKSEVSRTVDVIGYTVDLD